MPMPFRGLYTGIVLWTILWTGAGCTLVATPSEPLPQPVWRVCQRIATPWVHRTLTQPGAIPIPLGAIHGFLELEIERNRESRSGTWYIRWNRRTLTSGIDLRPGRYAVYIPLAYRWRFRNRMEIFWDPVDMQVRFHVRAFLQCWDAAPEQVTYRVQNDGLFWTVPPNRVLWVAFPVRSRTRITVEPMLPRTYRQVVHTSVTVYRDGRPGQSLPETNRQYTYVLRRLHRPEWITLRMETQCTQHCPETVAWRVRGQTASHGTGAGSSRRPEVRVHPTARPFSVFIFLVDALRADHLPCSPRIGVRYPRLFRLCRRSLRFHRAHAHAGWTRTSVASLLTGLLPAQHGVYGYEHRLPDEVPYLPELLHRAGYRTAAFVTNGNVGLRGLGFDRGFDLFRRFEENRQTPWVHTPATEVARAVQHWIERMAPRGRPLFGYIHFTDPHAPYAAPTVHSNGSLEFMRLLGQLRPDIQSKYRTPLLEQYRRDVDTALAGIEAVLETLYATGLDEHSLIVVTADHGEAFYEHACWQHGNCLFDEVLRVPLWIRLPGRFARGADIDVPVQHIDVVPTIAHLAHIRRNPAWLGHPLVRFSTTSRLYIAEQRLNGRYGMAIEYPPYRLIWREHRNTDVPLFYVFNESRDPTERLNLYVYRPLAIWHLFELRDRLHAMYITPSQTRPMTREERELLRALGYVQ